MKKTFAEIKKFFKVFGPGVVTGAADDDPSGIATYTQTGAKFGYGQLWTVIALLPLMVAVQEACARIGAVTGHGLSTVIKTNYSKKVLYAAVLLVVVANTINIGADIGALAAAARRAWKAHRGRSCTASRRALAVARRPRPRADRM